MPISKLAQALRDQHEESLVRQAETIRQWPIGRERHEQAMIHVRFALSEQGTGRISETTQYRIYSILSFVIANEAAFENDPAPLPELEREADIETAYYEQLKRQGCRDCGDGLCPANE